MNISDKSKKGYILEVDLQYPMNLHDFHNDLPLTSYLVRAVINIYIW